MLQVKKVLIIEDSSLMRLQVKHILEKEGFLVLELNNGEDYFSATWQYTDVGVILLDINLPGMDGLAVLKAMNNDKSVVWPPIIMLSASADKDTIRAALLLGANDYIVKPLSEERLLHKVEHIFNQPVIKKFTQRYSALVQIVKESFELYENNDYKVLPIEQIAVLVNECVQFVNCDEKRVLFNRETDMTDYTFRHGVNVAIASGLIGKWMGIKEQQLHDLVLAGLLHDLGKSQIPRELLIKSDELSSVEMDILKTHVNHSYNLINAGDFSEEVLLGVSQHHERMDGSGYPQSLLGKSICLNARIIAVADVYDAMTSNKFYRNAETPFVVIEELFKEMFDKLDSHICSVFLKNIKERLVGELVRLSDGSEAKVAYIEGEGFAEPVLHTADGRRIEFTSNLKIVEFVNVN